MAEKKKRPKHVSYQAQREQCRLNKFTYEEKIGGMPYLMCNYPFPQPEHKKGLCKASLCTDMREIPEGIVEADIEDGLTKDANDQAAHDEAHKEAEKSLSEETTGEKEPDPIGAVRAE